MKLPDVATRADMERLVRGRKLVYGQSFNADGLDKDIKEARALAPKLGRYDRADLEQWLDKVTGGGSGVMSADPVEANEIVEKFRFTLRVYRGRATEECRRQQEPPPEDGGA
jgi:hypothetical protein